MRGIAFRRAEKPAPRFGPGVAPRLPEHLHLGFVGVYQVVRQQLGAYPLVHPVQPSGVNVHHPVGHVLPAYPQADLGEVALNAVEGHGVAVLGVDDVRHQGRRGDGALQAVPRGGRPHDDGAILSAIGVGVAAGPAAVLLRAVLLDHEPGGDEPQPADDVVADLLELVPAFGAGAPVFGQVVLYDDGLEAGKVDAALAAAAMLLLGRGLESVGDGGLGRGRVGCGVHVVEQGELFGDHLFRLRPEEPAVGQADLLQEVGDLRLLLVELPPQLAYGFG